MYTKSITITSDGREASAAICTITTEKGDLHLPHVTAQGDLLDTYDYEPPHHETTTTLHPTYGVHLGIHLLRQFIPTHWKITLHTEDFKGDIDADELARIEFEWLLQELRKTPTDPYCKAWLDILGPHDDTVIEPD